jgi:hypothetical protein
VSIDPWAGAQQGEAITSEQMLAWWGNVDPALLQHLPVSDMHCRQWPRPRQDLWQPSLLAHMDRDQDRGR